MRYEMAKDSGEIPIVGVNTFLSDEGSRFVTPTQVIRSTDADKDRLISDLHRQHRRLGKESEAALEALQATVLSGGNVFAALMDAVRFCSLGQMSRALFEVGGRYRRNM